MEKQQKELTDGWDLLFIGYSAAVYFHTCDIKIKSWPTQAKKMRCSMPREFEVRDILRTLEQARLENMLPVRDDGRKIVVEGHIALKDETKFATRKHRAHHGLEQLEMKQEEKELYAAGPLYVALTEYKKLDPATPSPYRCALLETREAVPWRIGSETHLRENKLNQKEGRVWLRLSVKQEKKWR